MITFEEILGGALGDHEATSAKEWLDAGGKITPPGTDTDWVNVDSRPGHLDCRIFLEDLQVLGVPPDQPTIPQAKLNTAATNTLISTKKRTRNQISSAADLDSAPPPQQQLHWRALGVTDYSLAHKVDISPEGLLCIGASDTSAIKKAINDFFPQLVTTLVKKAKRKSGNDGSGINGGGGPRISTAATTTTTTATTTATKNNNNINTKAMTKPTTHSIEDSRSTALTLLPKDRVPGLLFHTVVGTGRIPGYIGRDQLEQTWPEAVQQQQGNTISNNYIKKIAIKVTTHHTTGRDLIWDLELVKRSQKRDDEGSGDEDSIDEEGVGEKYYLTGQIAGLLKKLKAQPGDVMSVIKTPDYSGMFDQEDTEKEEGGEGGGREPAAVVSVAAAGAGNEERKDKEPMDDNDAGAGKQSGIHGDGDMIDAQPPAAAAMEKEKQAPDDFPCIYLVELNAPEVLNAIADLAEEEDTSALPGPSASVPPPPFPPPQRPSPYDKAMRKIGRDTMTWVREMARGAPPPPPDIVGEKNACFARLVAQRRRAVLYLKQRKEALSAVNPPKEERSPVAIRGGKKSPGSGVGGKSPGGGGKGGLSPKKKLDLGEKKISKKKKDGKKG